jgi:hypothetical protein
MDGREGDRGIAVQAELGEEKVIFLNVSSNPPPRVSWIIDGKQLEQGRNNEVFEPIPLRNVAPFLYEIALKIKSVDDEVLAKRIELKVTNDLGVADYILHHQHQLIIFRFGYLRLTRVECAFLFLFFFI